MIKGGRQAKLYSKINEAKLRIEKLFMAFNKDSLNKLKTIILPEATNTPMVVQDVDNDFKDAVKVNLGKKGTHNLSKTIGRKSKLCWFIHIFQRIF